MEQIARKYSSDVFLEHTSLDANFHHSVVLRPLKISVDYNTAIFYHTRKVDVAATISMVETQLLYTVCGRNVMKRNETILCLTDRSTKLARKKQPTITTRG